MKSSTRHANIGFKEKNKRIKLFKNKAMLKSRVDLGCIEIYNQIVELIFRTSRTRSSG